MDQAVQTGGVGSSERRILRLLLRLVSQKRRQSTIYLVLLLAGAVLTSGKFLILDRLVQAGGNGAAAGQILWLLAGLLAAWFAGQAAVYFSAGAGQQIVRSIATELVHRTVEGLLRASSSNLHSCRADGAVHLLRTGMKVVTQSVTGILNAFSEATIVLAVAVGSLWINVWLGIWCLGAGVLAAVLSSRHLRTQMRGMTGSFQGSRKLHTAVYRLLQSLPQVKVYGNDQERLRRLLGPVRQQKRGERVALRGQRLISLELEIGRAASSLGVLGLSAWLIARGQAGVADAMSVLFLHDSIFTGMKQVLFQWGTAWQNQEFLSLLVEPQQYAHRPVVEGLPIDGPIQTLQCDNVEISGMQSPVHLAIDADLTSGRLYGIVGPSPAETLELLCALIDVSRISSGRLLVNGRNAAELDPDELRSRVALVTWPPLLFEGTLSANLRIAKPDAGDEELIETLRKVAFEDDLKQLEAVGGLETPLECQGVHLSVGQQQRLALARALLRDPDVLLLDDPFRGLDVESTQRSLESLREFSRRRLVVLVAPGETAMKVCDELMVVVHGRVIAQTTYQSAAVDPEISRHLFPGRHAA